MSCMGICELCICNILTQNHLSAFHFSVDVYGCILDAFDSGKSCAVLNFIVSWCHYVIGHYTLILVHRWQFQNRMQLNNNNVSVLVIEFYFFFFLERGIRAKEEEKTNCTPKLWATIVHKSLLYERCISIQKTLSFQLSNQKQSTCCLRHVCVYAQWAALPLILIDIWCAFGSIRFGFLREGRLIFNWLHQNEMKFIYNARKHFQNGYGETWRYFTGNELSCACIEWSQQC